MSDASAHAETWRPIAGYEGLYDVSDCGRVRSLMGHRRTVSHPLAVPRILAQGTGRYAQVVLCKGGIKTPHSVHILVLETFVGPRPIGMDGAHDDGRPRNNRAANLFWKTHAENVADKKRHGTWQAREANGFAKLNEAAVAAIRTSYVPMSRTHGAPALARKFDVSRSCVLNVVRRRTWTYQPHIEGAVR